MKLKINNKIKIDSYKMIYQDFVKDFGFNKNELNLKSLLDKNHIS